MEHYGADGKRVSGDPTKPDPDSRRCPHGFVCVSIDIGDGWRQPTPKGCTKCAPIDFPLAFKMGE